MKHILVTDNKINFEIDQLINSIAAKLPGVNLVGYEEKQRLELWNMQVTNYAKPIYEKHDHLPKLRFAWLSQGKVGLLRYVEKYAKSNRLDRVRKIILAIDHD